ncbi:MAG: PDZ domain-containing protein [Deltaproteobacteria bacterium]|nr:MAG: PDZ domain-containing protein [Deltaproteobacteria bacterium]
MRKNSAAPAARATASARAAVCRSVLAGAVAVAACRPAAAPAPADAPKADAGEPAHGAVEIVYPGAPGSFVALADEIAPGVVALRSTRTVVGGPADAFPGEDDPFALGSGFVIDGRGFILTNDHIVANAADIVARLHDGSDHRARVIGRDPNLDVALLQIDPVPGLRPLPLGDSDRLRRGEWVVAAGDAFGRGATMSAGIVSGVPAMPAGPLSGRARAYLQTDARIHAGNSGGPLVDLRGEVVGINTLFDPRQTAIGYALPINAAKRVLPQLRTDGVVKRAWLGAFVAPVTPEVAARVGLDRPRGAFVTNTVAGAPAAKAGLRRGDVILRFDGREVDERSLAWIAATAGIGRRVEVVVWRDGAERTLELVTEPLPE